MKNLVSQHYFLIVKPFYPTPVKSLEGFTGVLYQCHLQHIFGRKEIIDAAQYVTAHDFIQTLPGGYEEEVKERGCTLSAGQRQLLSFARAITFKPTIMVLDEATANIDTKTEGIIQDSLARISKNKTILIVAHRLSTIENADKIIVIHKGRIREMGKHVELLKKGGIYRSLYNLQYAHRV